jgi:hypothetical protein
VKLNADERSCTNPTCACGRMLAGKRVDHLVPARRPLRVQVLQPGEETILTARSEA